MREKIQAGDIPAMSTGQNGQLNGGFAMMAEKSGISRINEDCTNYCDPDAGTNKGCVNHCASWCPTAPATPTGPSGSGTPSYPGGVPPKPQSSHLF